MLEAMAFVIHRFLYIIFKTGFIFICEDRLVLLQLYLVGFEPPLATEHDTFA